MRIHPQLACTLTIAALWTACAAPDTPPRPVDEQFAEGRADEGADRPLEDFAGHYVQVKNGALVEDSTLQIAAHDGRLTASFTKAGRVWNAVTGILDGPVVETRGFLPGMTSHPIKGYEELIRIGPSKIVHVRDELMLFGEDEWHHRGTLRTRMTLTDEGLSLEYENGIYERSSTAEYVRVDGNVASE